jgi:hypothetical protein
MLASALVAVAVAAPTHSAMDAAKWAVLTTADHADAGTVTIWSSTVSGVDCFRGTATTDVAKDKLLAVVVDIEGAKRWSSAGITEARLLGSGGGAYSYYQYLDVPGWTMASDRFWFLRSTVRKTDTELEFVWDPLPATEYADVHSEVVAAHPDAVEPPINVGSWKFSQKGAGVEITYSICTQPGGSLPVAIQNAATRKTLPDTVGDVVREGRKR